MLDEKKDVGASNRRQLAALYCGANSGFEVLTLLFCYKYYHKLVLGLGNGFILQASLTSRSFFFSLQLIHCLVDRIMEVIGSPFVPVGDKTGYYIQLSNVSCFFCHFSILSYLLCGY